MSGPMLPRERSEYSAIVDRPALKLPGGAHGSYSGPSSISKYGILQNLYRTVAGGKLGVAA